jgi:A/G-specific adenine glycosylase
MAVDIETRFNGQIPHSFEDLISLPGVNHYIASAVRCFAFGYPDILLDTNTVRVAGRVFGLPITDSSRRSKLFREVLERFMDSKHPRELNFALIDFAAEICKPKASLHDMCPIHDYCRFYLQIIGKM